MLGAKERKPVPTDWASKVLFVLKTDCELRSRVDYWVLNSRILRDSNSSPRMKECIHSPGDAMLLSAQHMINGYWQTEDDKADGEKAVFKFHHDAYRLIKMAFCLKNYLATFQCVIDIIR